MAIIQFTLARGGGWGRNRRSQPFIWLTSESHSALRAISPPLYDIQNPSSTQEVAFSGIQCLSNLEDTLYNKALFSGVTQGSFALASPRVAV